MSVSDPSFLDRGGKEGHAQRSPEAAQIRARVSDYNARQNGGYEPAEMWPLADKVYAAHLENERRRAALTALEGEVGK